MPSFYEFIQLSYLCKTISMLLFVMNLTIKSEDGKSINTIDDWLKYSPPAQKDAHWKDYRSAKELAKFTLSGNLRKKIDEIVASLLIDIPTEYVCIPESKTELPWGDKGKRNHDLEMIGNNDLIICIEAKADEPFDKSILNKRRLAEKNKDGGANMNLRLEGIINYLYPTGKPNNCEQLMYQLLSATAGTIKEAVKHNKNKAIALFLVFRSKKTNDALINENNICFSEFCNSLGLSDEGGMIRRDGINCWIKKIIIDIH